MLNDMRWFKDTYTSFDVALWDACMCWQQLWFDRRQDGYYIFTQKQAALVAYSMDRAKRSARESCLHKYAHLAKIVVGRQYSIKTSLVVRKSVGPVRKSIGR